MCHFLKCYITITSQSGTVCQGVGWHKYRCTTGCREPTPILETTSTLSHGGRGSILRIPGTTIKIICYNILATVIHPHELQAPPLPQPKDAPHAVRNHGNVFWPNRTSHRSFSYRWSGKLGTNLYSRAKYSAGTCQIARI